MKSHGSYLVQALLFSTLLCAAASSSRAEVVYGLSQNTLFSFDSANPSSVNGMHSVSGLLQGDSLISLDIRPATGQLYGLGSSLRLYTLNPNTGAASVVNSTPLGSPVGTRFSLDFDPAADLGRVVGSGSQNFRVRPDGTGAISDGALAYAVNDPNFGHDPSITSAAYGKTGGSLFGIDSKSDTLVRLDLPNSGVEKTVGLLGINTTENASLDVSGSSGLAFASLTRPGDSSSSLYRIDLQTGQATLIGPIGFGSPLVGLVAQVPEPAPWALGVLGLAGFWLLRHRPKQWRPSCS